MNIKPAKRRKTKDLCGSSTELLIYFLIIGKLSTPTRITRATLLNWFFPDIFEEMEFSGSRQFPDLFSKQKLIRLTPTLNPFQKCFIFTQNLYMAEEKNIYYLPILWFCFEQFQPLLRLRDLLFPNFDSKTQKYCTT